MQANAQTDSANAAGGNDNPQTSYDVPVRQPWELACFAQWFKDSSVISYVSFRTILRFVGPELWRERLPLNLEHVPPVCGWKHFYGQLTAAVLSTYNCLVPSMLSVISPVMWLQSIAFR